MNVRMMVGLAAIVAALGCTKTTTTRGGVPNLLQVSATVWRSGQPTTAAGWSEIKALGVVHVLKLNFESEGTDDGARAAGLDVHVLSMQPEGDQEVFDNIANTFVLPSAVDVETAEILLGSGGVWLVHCTHGQDRTGYVVGRYRVLHDRWDKAAAYDEMLRLGFHPLLHGLHEAWERF